MIQNCLFQHTIIFSQTAEPLDITTRAPVCQSVPIRFFFSWTWRGRKVLLNILPSTLKPTCEKSISHAERWNRKCARTALQPHFLLHLGCNIAVTSCLNTRPRVGQRVGEALPEEAAAAGCSLPQSQMWKIIGSSGILGWRRAAVDAGCDQPPSLETHLSNSLDAGSCLWSKTLRCFHSSLPVWNMLVLLISHLIFTSAKAVANVTAGVCLLEKQLKLMKGF